jgi:hypothetical protein
MKSPGVERVAETHFSIRPALTSALRNFGLAPDGQAMFPGCTNYWDVWTLQFSDKYFDMGTLIRAAASVETSLRDYYVTKKGFLNLTQLRQDPSYKQNVFQRIMPWNGNDSATALFQALGVDLTIFPDFPKVQELVLHRHLYAHNLGVIDDQYIARLKTLTGKDLLLDPTVAAQYPAQDVVWFEPLSRLPQFINAARGMFSQLPP